MRQSGSLPSVILALLLTASAGFPSLMPTKPALTIQLMSMTELKSGEGGHYFVKAAINNTDINVLVDTGASVVALSFEDAERAGLHPSNLDYKIPVSTANGQVNAARVKLNRVEIDNVRVDDVDAMVLPEGALKGTLLGMSFLSKLSSFKSEDGVLTLKN
ncbi:MAG: TIGR02281 family clan AA aspartic protease [Aestuariivirga sp.]|jgi:aspartyl protease family protein